MFVLSSAAAIGMAVVQVGLLFDTFSFLVSNRVVVFVSIESVNTELNLLLTLLHP